MNATENELSREADQASEGTTKNPLPVEQTLVERLKARHVWINEGCSHAIDLGPDGDCQKAADLIVSLRSEIETLKRERDGAHKAADWNANVVADRDASLQQIKGALEWVRDNPGAHPENIKRVAGSALLGLPSVEAHASPQASTSSVEASPYGSPPASAYNALALAYERGAHWAVENRPDFPTYLRKAALDYADKATFHSDRASGELSFPDEGVSPKEGNIKTPSPSPEAVTEASQ